MLNMICQHNCSPDNTKVTLLFGGRSSEREVSIMSANAVYDALIELGFDVVKIDTGEKGYIQKLEESNPDAVFISLHGKGGEDGCVQGICEELDFPYTGCGVLACALAMDKTRSKVFYRTEGIDTPNYLEIAGEETISAEDIVDELGEKVVIKPVKEGSTIGMTIANGISEIEEGIELAKTFDSSVLIEQFVEGVEVTVAVLGNENLCALPVLEIVPKEGFYDYEAKYQEGGADHFCPARIDDELTQKCQELSIIAHKTLGCEGISRSDIIIDNEGVCWMLETNTIPGTTATSLVPDAAKVAGIEFPDFCKLMIDMALEKKKA